jgi:hypothetical protein
LSLICYHAERKQSINGLTLRDLQTASRALLIILIPGVICLENIAALAVERAKPGSNPGSRTFRGLAILMAILLVSLAPEMFHPRTLKKF